MIKSSFTPNISVNSSIKNKFKFTELRLFIKDLPEDLEDYHIVQFSDPHLGVYTSLKFIQSAFQFVNNLSPHLVLLTGDYIHLGRHEVKEILMKMLGTTRSRYRHYRRMARTTAISFGKLIEEELNPPDGIIGIWGNHDYLEGKRTLIKYLPDSITWLENETWYIDKGSISLKLSGIDDYRLGEPNIKKTLSSSIGNPPGSESKVALFLSHNPDVITLPDHHLLQEFDLMLCGHTHGGQVCLPGSIPIKTETRQRQIFSGLTHFEKLPVYVSNGIGCSGLPFRVFCPPEIVSIYLNKAK